jgi:hypothetical protein
MIPRQQVPQSMRQAEHQDGHPVLVTVDVALALDRPVNDVVEILPRLVVRRDDERRMWLLDVLVRDRVQAFLAWTDFVHATLLVEAFDRTWISPRESCSTTAFNSGSRCRTISSRCAVRIPDSWSW